MLEQTAAYLDALAEQFAKPRKLPNGTVLTGFTKDELQMIGAFVEDLARFDGGAEQFWGFYDMGADANPYVVAFLGWMGLLGAMAEQAGKRVVYATTTSGMQSAARNHYRSLFVLRDVEFASWGDVAQWAARRPAALASALIIGDVDGPSCGPLMSSDGTVGHAETVRVVHGLAKARNAHRVFIHREGADSPFDLDALARRSAQAGSSPLQKRGFWSKLFGLD